MRTISQECGAACTLENSAPAFWAAQVSKVPPEISRLRRQSFRVRSGFLQSAHFAEMGRVLKKSRVFLKAPAQVLKTRARRFGETSSVAVCRKGPAALGKRAVADVGIQSGADLRKAERALRSA